MSSHPAAAEQIRIRFRAILDLFDDTDIIAALRLLDEGSRATLEASLRAVRGPLPGQPDPVMTGRLSELAVFALELAGLHAPSLHHDERWYCTRCEGIVLHPCREYEIADVLLAMLGFQIADDEIARVTCLADAAGIIAVKSGQRHGSLRQLQREDVPVLSGGAAGSELRDPAHMPVPALSDDDSEAQADAAQQRADWTRVPWTGKRL